MDNLREEMARPWHIRDAVAIRKCWRCDKERVDDYRVYTAANLLQVLRDEEPEKCENCQMTLGPAVVVPRGYLIVEDIEEEKEWKHVLRATYRRLCRAKPVKG